MKPVRYWNMFYDQTFEGFLIDPSNKLCMIAHPYLPGWLENIGQLSRIRECGLWEVESERIIRSGHVNVSHDTWFHKMSISEELFPYMQTICNFFEFIPPQASGDVLLGAVKNALQSNSKVAPPFVWKAIIEFLLETYKDDPVRLAILVSSDIQEYL